ncbi:hypothetical protein SAMN06273572_10751 [Monaibacterium marinum]|uniref:Protease inhibitor Inh n=1 Tax=Pontivivens marinum TaxID=1690039 RepID=A0A2C9CUZ4_9RHOB|nr:hypothetical protein [Monaibacterium marinum]SOH95030.1 hypothetical protein SAMN06273572_10751 [Monaibacterium marinum]
MMLKYIGILTGMMLSAGSVLAQENISPRDFLDLVTGQTAWFSAPSGLVGIEHFNGDGTTRWLRRDGSCTQGQITVQDAEICFTYEDSSDQTYCWVPRLDGNELSVRSTDVSEAVQIVSRISRTRLHCAVDGAGV